MDEKINVLQAAKILGVKPQTIRKWRMLGKITPTAGRELNHKGYPLTFWKSDIEKMLTD